MNDIDKKCWEWSYVGFNVGDSYPTSILPKLYTLEFALYDYMSTPNRFNITSDEEENKDWRLYKVINKKVICVLTIDEAKRVLKLHQL
jgi:hypothetical protein